MVNQHDGLRFQPLHRTDPRRLAESDVGARARCSDLIQHAESVRLRRGVDRRALTRPVGSSSDRRRCSSRTRLRGRCESCSAPEISLPYHNPLWAAERVVLLDHLTRGRVIFGMGPGSLPPTPP